MIYEPIWPKKTIKTRLYMFQSHPLIVASWHWVDICDPSVNHKSSTGCTPAIDLVALALPMG
jgi:hypothetical protein